MLVACAPAHPSRPVGAATVDGDEIALYRDAAFVHQRVEFDAVAGQVTRVEVEIAGGVDADEVVIPDRGDVEVKELHAIKGTPSRLQLVLAATRPGHRAVHLAYLTDQLTWEAGYTLTTTPRRERASLRGAVAVANASGHVFARATVSVIDAELGSWRGKTMALLSGKLTGQQPAGAPIAQPRSLGQLALPAGQTRIELLAGESTRAMRSVLVFDPVGTQHDNTGGTPMRDAMLGLLPRPSTRVTESFEIERDGGATANLPSGPARLLERRPDGELALLGETRLFDAATRVADVDTIPIGTATGIVAHRERRELTIDDDAKRLTEEFAITIESTRPAPVEVVVREHLYRSQNWSLAYHSALSAAKEGPQQIALRTRVPANGHTKLIYVAVYTW